MPLCRMLSGLAQPDVLLKQRLYSRLHADNPNVDKALAALIATYAVNTSTLLTPALSDLYRQCVSAGISG